MCDNCRESGERRQWSWNCSGTESWPWAEESSRTAAFPVLGKRFRLHLSAETRTRRTWQPSGPKRVGRTTAPLGETPPHRGKLQGLLQNPENGTRGVNFQSPWVADGPKNSDSYSTVPQNVEQAPTESATSPIEVVKVTLLKLRQVPREEQQSEEQQRVAPFWGVDGPLAHGVRLELDLVHIEKAVR